MKEGENVSSGLAMVSKGLPGTDFIRADGDVPLGAQELLKYKVFGQEVYLTTTHISLIIVVVTLLVFALIVNRVIKKADPEKVPGHFLNVVETIVEMIDNMVNETMGIKNGPKFANYIGTLAFFLILANLSGLLGLRPPTADYGVTLPLGLITFVLIQFNGFKHQKMGKVKGWFEPIPLFFPINIIGDLATPVSLSLRLFGNILSGTVMLGLLYGLLPKVLTLVWPAFLHAYLDMFSGAIQTYVFCMLTMVFISDAFGEEA